jgi:predicted kinase
MSFYVIIRGPLGCGKSTISEKLSTVLKAKYIGVDRVLDEHNLTGDKEAGYISQASFKQANELIAPIAKKFIESGTPVVFDGNFYWKSQIEDLIKRLDFPHYVFTLQAPLEVCIERDRKRIKKHGKDAAEAVYKKSTEFCYGIPIDVMKPIKETIKEILANLPG